MVEILTNCTEEELSKFNCYTFDELYSLEEREYFNLEMIEALKQSQVGILKQDLPVSEVTPVITMNHGSITVNYSKPIFSEVTINGEVLKNKIFETEVKIEININEKDIEDIRIEYETLLGNNRIVQVISSETIVNELLKQSDIVARNVAAEDLKKLDKNFLKQLVKNSRSKIMDQPFFQLPLAKEALFEYQTIYFQSGISQLVALNKALRYLNSNATDLRISNIKEVLSKENGIEMLRETIEKLEGLVNTYEVTEITELIGDRYIDINHIAYYMGIEDFRESFGIESAIVLSYFITNNIGLSKETNEGIVRYSKDVVDMTMSEIVAALNGIGIEFQTKGLTTDSEELAVAKQILTLFQYRYVPTMKLHADDSQQTDIATILGHVNEGDTLIEAYVNSLRSLAEEKDPENIVHVYKADEAKAYLEKIAPEIIPNFGGILEIATAVFNPDGRSIQERVAAINTDVLDIPDMNEYLPDELNLIEQLEKCSKTERSLIDVSFGELVLMMHDIEYQSLHLKEYSLREIVNAAIYYKKGFAEVVKELRELELMINRVDRFIPITKKLIYSPMEIDSIKTLNSFSDEVLETLGFTFEQILSYVRDLVQDVNSSYSEILKYARPKGMSGIDYLFYLTDLFNSLKTKNEEMRALRNTIFDFPKSIKYAAVIENMIGIDAEDLVRINISFEELMLSAEVNNEVDMGILGQKLFDYSVIKKNISINDIQNFNQRMPEDSIFQIPEEYFWTKKEIAFVKLLLDKGAESFSKVTNSYDEIAKSDIPTILLPIALNMLQQGKSLDETVARTLSMQEKWDNNGFLNYSDYKIEIERAVKEPFINLVYSSADFPKRYEFDLGKYVYVDGHASVPNGGIGVGVVAKAVTIENAGSEVNGNKFKLTYETLNGKNVVLVLEKGTDWVNIHFKRLQSMVFNLNNSDDEKQEVLLQKYVNGKFYLFDGKNERTVLEQDSPEFETAKAKLIAQLTYSYSLNPREEILGIVSKLQKSNYAGLFESKAKLSSNEEEAWINISPQMDILYQDINRKNKEITNKFTAPFFQIPKKLEYTDREMILIKIVLATDISLITHNPSMSFENTVGLSVKDSLLGFVFENYLIKGKSTNGIAGSINLYNTIWTPVNKQVDKTYSISVVNSSPAIAETIEREYGLRGVGTNAGRSFVDGIPTKTTLFPHQILVTGTTSYRKLYDLTYKWCGRECSRPIYTPYWQETETDYTESFINYIGINSYLRTSSNDHYDFFNATVNVLFNNYDKDEYSKEYILRGYRNKGTETDGRPVEDAVKIEITYEKPQQITFELKDSNSAHLFFSHLLRKSDGTYTWYPSNIKQGTAQFEAHIDHLVNHLLNTYGNVPDPKILTVIEHLQNRRLDQLFGIQNISGTIYAENNTDGTPNYVNRISNMLSTNRTAVLSLKEDTVKGYVHFLINKIMASPISEEKSLVLFQAIQQMYSAAIPAAELGGVGQYSKLFLSKLSEYIEKGIISPLPVTGETDNETLIAQISNLPQQMGILQSNVAVSVPAVDKVNVVYTVGKKTITYKLELGTDGIVNKITTEGRVDESMEIRLPKQIFAEINGIDESVSEELWEQLKINGILDADGKVTNRFNPKDFSENNLNLEGYYKNKLPKSFKSSMSLASFEEAVSNILKDNYSGSYFGSMDLDSTDLNPNDIKYLNARIYQALVGSYNPELSELFELTSAGKLKKKNATVFNRMLNSGAMKSEDSEVFFFFSAKDIVAADNTKQVQVTMIENGKGVEPLPIRLTFNKLENGNLDPANGKIEVKNFITDNLSKNSEWQELDWLIVGATNASDCGGDFCPQGIFDDIFNFLKNVFISWAMSMLGGFILQALAEAAKGIQVVQQVMQAAQWVTNLKETADSFLKPIQDAAEIVEQLKDPNKLLDSYIPHQVKDFKKEVEDNVIKIEKTLKPITNTGEALKQEYDEKAKVYIKVQDKVIDATEAGYIEVKNVVDENAGEVTQSLELEVNEFRQYVDKNMPEIKPDFGNIQIETVVPKSDFVMPEPSDIEFSANIKVPVFEKKAIIPTVEINEEIDGAEFKIQFSNELQKIEILTGNHKLLLGNALPEYIDMKTGKEYSFQEIVNGNVEIDEYQRKLNQAISDNFMPIVGSQNTIDNNTVLSMNENSGKIDVTLNNLSFGSVHANYDISNGQVTYNVSADIPEEDMYYLESIDTINYTEVADMDTVKKLIKGAVYAPYKFAVQQGIGRVMDNVKAFKHIWGVINHDKPRLTDEELTKDLAKLCNLVYQKRSKEFENLLDKKWEAIDLSDIDDGSDEQYYYQNKQTGYVGAFVKSKTEDKYIMIHRGTDPDKGISELIKDWTTNFSIGLGFEAQIADAKRFYEAIRAKEEFANVKIRHTGHSLGGAISQILARENHDKYGDDSINFNPLSPWAVIERNGDIDADVDIDYINNYVTITDIVPILVPQLGRMYFEESPLSDDNDSYLGSLAYYAKSGAIRLPASFGNIQDELVSHKIDFHIDGFDEAESKGMYNVKVPLFWLIYKNLLRGTIIEGKYSLKDIN